MTLEATTVDSLRAQFSDVMARVRVKSDLDLVRVDWLGKEGILKNLFAELRNVPASEKPKVAQMINQLRDDAERLIREQEESFAKESRRSKMNSSMCLFLAHFLGMARCTR